MTCGGVGGGVCRTLVNTFGLSLSLEDALSPLVLRTTIFCTGFCWRVPDNPWDPLIPDTPDMTASKKEAVEGALCNFGSFTLEFGSRRGLVRSANGEGKCEGYAGPIPNGWKGVKGLYMDPYAGLYRLRLNDGVNALGYAEGQKDVGGYGAVGKKPGLEYGDGTSLAVIETWRGGFERTFALPFDSAFATVGEGYPLRWVLFPRDSELEVLR